MYLVARPWSRLALAVWLIGKNEVLRPAEWATRVGSVLGRTGCVADLVVRMVVAAISSQVVAGRMTGSGMDVTAC
jgi:hypothetical protein